MRSGLTAWLRWGIGCVALLLGAAVGGSVSPDPPNLVVILIDDAGAGDFGFDGAVLAETPHLDRLAREGLRFTSGYAPAPICSASRASILTGRSPARLQFEFVTKASGAAEPKTGSLRQPPFPRDFPLEEITLAEMLGPAGYVAGYFGKWHLTQTSDRYLGHGTTHGPRQQGFAEASEERGSHPYSYPRPAQAPVRDQPAGVYEEDRLADEAIEFLRRHRQNRFLLYLATYYVHDPVDTRCGWLIEKYRAKAERLGLKGVAASEERVRYAAFVDVMDHSVGRVLAAIDEQGLRERTLVILLSDNGGHPRFSENGGLRGSKWTLYEGGIRVPFLARWPGVIPANASSEVPVVGTDVFPTFAAIAGVPLPDRPLDGVNLLPVFRDPSATLPRRRLTFHFPFYHEPYVNETPVSALREGNLKLVFHYEKERAELFDLAADPHEEHDLASARPHDAARLKARLLADLRAAGARFPRAWDAE